MKYYLALRFLLSNPRAALCDSGIHWCGDEDCHWGHWHTLARKRRAKRLRRAGWGSWSQAELDTMVRPTIDTSKIKWAEQCFPQYTKKVEKS